MMVIKNFLASMALVMLITADGFKPLGVRPMVKAPILTPFSPANKLPNYVSYQSSKVLTSTASAVEGDGGSDKSSLNLRTLPLKTVKKLLPLGLMLFFILFNYTILRDTKDVLVVTAPNSGAEIIPFLKTYVNLPSAIAFTLAYSSLSNRMPADKVFYIVMTSFLSFFGAFAGFICKCPACSFCLLVLTVRCVGVDPNRMLLHPNLTADWLATILPSFFLVSFLSLYAFYERLAGSCPMPPSGL